MPINCVWLDKAPEGIWEPGWCFYAPFEYDLSKHYLAEVRQDRPPIMVVLPIRGPHRIGGTQFIIDSHPTSDPEGNWEVQIEGSFVDGQKPDITVTPSINALGIYHGYLTHGVLTDDLG